MGQKTLRPHRSGCPPPRPSQRLACPSATCRHRHGHGAPRRKPQTRKPTHHRTLHRIRRQENRPDTKRCRFQQTRLRRIRPLLPLPQELQDVRRQQPDRLTFVAPLRPRGFQPRPSPSPSPSVPGASSLVPPPLPPPLPPPSLQSEKTLPLRPLFPYLYHVVSKQNYPIPSFQFPVTP
jgi:hypothetical protein